MFDEQQANDQILNNHLMGDNHRVNNDYIATLRRNGSSFGLLYKDSIKIQTNKTQDLKNLIKTQQQQQREHQSDIFLNCRTIQNQKQRLDSKSDQQIEITTNSIQQYCFKEKESQNIKEIIVECLQKSLSPQQATANSNTGFNIHSNEVRQMNKPKNSHFSCQQDDTTYQSESLKPQIDLSKQYTKIQSSTIQGGPQTQINEQNYQAKKVQYDQIQHTESQKQQKAKRDQCELQTYEITQTTAINSEQNQSRTSLRSIRLSMQQLNKKFDQQKQQQRQQKFQQKLHQQMLKAKKYFQRRLKDPKIKRSLRALPAKFKKLPQIKELLILEIEVDLINEIERCKTYDCQFLNFLIPYLYLLASILNYYEYESSKNLSIYYIFTQLINKINRIMNKNNAQLTKEELLDHLVKLANYRKYTSQELNSMVGDFLKKHSLRMRGFMPAYYDIFSFHAFQKYGFVESLLTLPDIRSKRQKVSERLQKLWVDIRKKYHNQNI